MKLLSKSGEQISQEMIGLFFEDINFAADGGLYAEMLENRSFEAEEAFGNPNNFYTVADYGYAWSAYDGGLSDQPILRFVSGTPLSEVNPHYLRLTTLEDGQGFKNKAYDGVFVKKGFNYKVSFYARCVRYEGETFGVHIEKDGKKIASSKVEAVHAAPYIPFVDLTVEGELGEYWTAKKIEYDKIDKSKMCKTNDWIKYETTLTATEDASAADFVITLEKAGVVDFDLVSMIPEDAVAGVFRKDLFEALKAIKPGFVRFPGGCIVEGISLLNRYRWKQTVGELKDRKYIPSLWAFDDDRKKTDLNAKRPDSHYGQSYGIGFYEYFLLCELLGAKPLPILNVGIACQFRSTEIVPVDSPEFEEYIQDALDLIEFANGPVDSKWGSLRAKMGHPEAFNLEMVGAGNEQWETKSIDFLVRHDRFEKAIHEKYPEIKLVGSAGPGVDLPLTELAWKFYREGKQKKENYVSYVDEHYYVAPEWLYSNIDFYNDYPREVSVFAGEYAAHPADRENTLSGALAEAAFLTGVEKNAGVVKLASYAPLFNRIGHSQWKPDMIWFDSTDVYLTPSYQVQKMYGNNLGTETVPMEGQEIELREKGIYVSVSKNGEKELIIKAVNSSDSAYELALEKEDGSAVAGMAKLQVLVASGKKEDNMPEPSEIKELEATLAGALNLEANSFTVCRICR